MTTPPVTWWWWWWVSAMPVVPMFTPRAPTSTTRFRTNSRPCPTRPRHPRPHVEALDAVAVENSHEVHQVERFNDVDVPPNERHITFTRWSTSRGRGRAAQRAPHHLHQVEHFT